MILFCLVYAITAAAGYWVEKDGPLEHRGVGAIA
jgi:hypothetical protein